MEGHFKSRQFSAAVCMKQDHVVMHNDVEQSIMREECFVLFLEVGIQLLNKLKLSSTQVKFFDSENFNLISEQKYCGNDKSTIKRV